jgi:hypothetical protein
MEQEEKRRLEYRTSIKDTVFDALVLLKVGRRKKEKVKRGLQTQD